MHRNGPFGRPTTFCRVGVTRCLHPENWCSASCLGDTSSCMPPRNIENQRILFVQPTTQTASELAPYRNQCIFREEAEHSHRRDGCSVGLVWSRSLVAALRGGVRQILSFVREGFYVAIPVGLRASVRVEIPASDDVGSPASHGAVESGQHAEQGSRANAHRVSGQREVGICWCGSHGSLWEFAISGS